jgi:hypothetical protein
VSSGHVRRLLAVTLLAFSLVSCQGDADFSEAAPKPVILNADEYRKEITAIDRLVFDPQPFLDERSAALTARLEELAARVKTVSDSKFLALEALELRRLSARARNFRSDGRADFSNQWMRIRNNLFDDRSWFARSAADLEPR